MEKKDDYRRIYCRTATGWVHKDDLQPNRLLEINFIDVGQGDGCFIVTPKDEVILVDAGQGKNMYYFLKWRFNLERNDTVVNIKHLIISHPDSDHYFGFKYIIDSPRFQVENIYHNGIIERTGADSLGPLDESGNYLADVKVTHQDVSSLVSSKTERGGMKYPNLLYDAIEKGVNNISMLEKGSVIPGYGPQDDIYLNVLGPVTEQIDGKKMLKDFKEPGVTKNGHSVIIQLVMNKVKVLLGGDLNDASEEYLGEHYTGYIPGKVSEQDKMDMIQKGRAIFESDVVKSCHHGSHKFIDDFLSFFNPVATIISSGDNESHTHPRPDTLGSIGKHSRGERPLIFSTELARSAVDKMNIVNKDIAQLSALYEKLKTASEDEKTILEKTIAQIKYEMERVIAVYGMINVRTDGEKIIIAQKKEERSAGFIIYELHPDENGRLAYKAK